MGGIISLINQPQYQILIGVGLAILLGACIGVEREIADKPAGLRTHMLVAGVAALLVGLGDIIVQHFSLNLGGSVVQADPIRIVEAVITGISFLGAGTILRRKPEYHVEGLTTAASILTAAGIGICVALSQLVLAIGVTILALITLRGVPGIERWLRRS